MDNKISSSSKITDPTVFFEKNQNNIYIHRTSGLREFDEEDDLGQQLKNLQLTYKFNVNETIIFRSYYSYVILIYIPMNDDLYCFRFEQPVLSIFILFDNIILFYLKDSVQIVNIKDLTTKLYKIDILTLKMIYTLSKTFIKDKNKIKIELEDYCIELKNPPINYLKNKLPQNYFINLKIGTECERIWSTFVLQKETCYCISIITDTRHFKYVIHLNDNEEKILSLPELIEFLHESFYSPLKYKTFLYSENNVSDSKTRG